MLCRSVFLSLSLRDFMEHTSITMRVETVPNSYVVWDTMAISIQLSPVSFTCVLGTVSCQINHTFIELIVYSFLTNVKDKEKWYRNSFLSDKKKNQPLQPSLMPIQGEKTPLISCYSNQIFLWAAAIIVKGLWTLEWWRVLLYNIYMAWYFDLIFCTGKNISNSLLYVNIL